MRYCKFICSSVEFRISIRLSMLRLYQSLIHIENLLYLTFLFLEISKTCNEMQICSSYKFFIN